MKTQPPSGEFRFKLLAEHPVAAVLHFENVLDYVIEHVIGWCQKIKKKQKKGDSLVSRKLGCELLRNNLGSTCPLSNMDKWPC